MSVRFPVSVKGVLPIGGAFALLRNARMEWELPGGRLEPGEQPESCVAREIAEELGLSAEVGAIVDSWLYEIPGHGSVFIVTYACRVRGAGVPTISAEHSALRLARPDEIEALSMPEGYKRSIRAVASRLRS
jgi:8-oxo-dGTP pyrophosphatase MutT (NUDIX family)